MNKVLPSDEEMMKVSYYDSVCGNYVMNRINFATKYSNFATYGQPRNRLLELRNGLYELHNR